ncbi:MAG TPA: CRISPR-associated protein Cas4, partial [Ignavibacteria bacterium]|nr:CRISPR-associated protein Cas4 [Ignavibacteria bacterium]
MSVTPSHIIEYLYCPRFTYFEYVLSIPQYEERHYKIQKGRQIHELKLVRNREYLRKKTGAVEKYTDQYLTNGYLRGKVDEVLLLSDGTMAPLDYKFAVYKERIFET